MIVIVEDEMDILELIEYRLLKEGYKVVCFSSFRGVLELLEEEGVDILIIDRNIANDIEGSVFVKKIRNSGIMTPVIYLTAKNQPSDIEEGFLSGGDDYITKPFNIKELILRIKAILKRGKYVSDSGKIKHRDIIIDLDLQSVEVNGKTVNLTRLEFALLYELINNKPALSTKSDLIEKIWMDYSLSDRDNTVSVAIHRLMKKIDPKKDKNYIRNIRGLGYTVC